MDQNEKSLEEMFEEVTASPEELAQVTGGAAPRLFEAQALSTDLIYTRILPTVDLSTVADLSGFFNRGLGSLDGGLAFRPDRDVGH